MMMVIRREVEKLSTVAIVNMAIYSRVHRNVMFPMSTVPECHVGVAATPVLRAPVDVVDLW